MPKKMEYSRYDAIQRLVSFIKLRKGKTITEKTVKDFVKLLDNMYDNFKGYNMISVWESDITESEIREKAINTIKSDFIQFERGGVYRKDQIKIFSLYKDDKYRVDIGDERIEITKNDFTLLNYVFQI